MARTYPEYDHPFMAFAAAESAALDDCTEWRRWLSRVKSILGHDLDGDNTAEARTAGTADGYSLDGAYDAYEARIPSSEYARRVQSDPAYHAPIDGVLYSDLVRTNAS